MRLANAQHDEPVEARAMPTRLASLAGRGRRTMLKTRLCELLGLEVPIILAPTGTCTSAELAAAVSNEGGLGGIGTSR